jgi:hypothetical protein
VIQREFVEASEKYKKCEENLEISHMMMEAMNFGAEIREINFDEVKNELKSVKKVKKFLGFLVAILSLALIGVGVFYIKGRTGGLSGNYVRSFLI